MNNLVKVNNKEIPIIEWKGKRVITTAQLADVYEATETQIKQNYGNNMERFKEGEHFYLLKGEELKAFKRLVENFDLPFVENLKFTSQLYLWTRRGASRHCKMLGTDKAWEQFDALEENYYNPTKALPTGEELLAIAVIEAQKSIAEKNKQIEEMQPKAIFADAVSASKTSILIGDLAKLICQNGVQIGQKRLFEWLRNNGYLIKSGSSRNMPMQRYVEQGLFEIKESNVQNPDGSVRITKTTKVTGKGQVYFVNKFGMATRMQNGS